MNIAPKTLTAALSRNERIRMRSTAEEHLTRVQLRARRLHVVRARTEDVHRIAKRDLLAGREAFPDVEGLERPRTRGDCVGGERPCPFVSCRHHLYLDVNERKNIKINFPHLELEELDDTCSLDVADRGGVTMEEAADRTNVSRARVGQIEEKVFARLKKKAAHLRDDLDKGVRRGEELRAAGDDVQEGGGTYSQAPLSDEEQAEKDFTDRIWRTYQREAAELAEGPRELTPLPRWSGPVPEITGDELEEPAPVSTEAVAPAVTTEETSMDIEDRGEACLASARELAVDGYRPGMLEIAKHAGIAGGTEDYTRAMVRTALQPYRDSGVLDWGARRAGGVFFLTGDDPPAPAKREKKPSAGHKKASPKPRPQPKALRPSPPASNDPLVVQLRERRALLLAQVDKLNVAIDALEAG